MTTENLFDAADKAQDKSNVPELSVSELALSLKRTLEETYGRIRVRGELYGIKVAASGHLYGDIKDEDANVNIVCWRGTLSKLSIKPEDGLEVIVTGRVSSYPKSSRYQIIVDSMEMAGEGALLKMLEERRKKLAAEGLFDPARKKPLPFLPDVIGVVTSPTGAVIRDIMHRLADRFPRHVLLWPVMVQGEGSAAQIAAAIEGFNKMDAAGKTPRPDLLIVARGGGSLEDLMAFNEENVVRAVADSDIPVISAVGHETDTTLVDYAADVRAPTPTGAAEMAVPRRADLLARIMENQERLFGALNRQVVHLRNILETQAAKLGDPRHLLENKTQSIDYLGDKLAGSFQRFIDLKRGRAGEIAAMLRHPKTLLNQKQSSLKVQSDALMRRGPRVTEPFETRLKNLDRLLKSYSYKDVLKRGFAVIRDADGNLIARAAQTAENMAVEIEFADEQKVGATLGKRSKT